MKRVLKWCNYNRSILTILLTIVSATLVACNSYYYKDKMNTNNTAPPLVKNVVEVCNRTMKSKLHVVKNESEDAHLVYEIFSCCIDETKNGCFTASPPTIIFHHRASIVELEKYRKNFKERD